MENICDESPAVGTLTWSVCHAEGWQPIENLIIQEVWNLTTFWSGKFW